VDALARLGSRALAAGYADARRFGGAVPGRACRDMVVPADDRGFAMMACPVGGPAPDKTSRRHLQRHGDDTGNGNAAGADIRWQRHEWRQKEEKYAVAHDRHSRTLPPLAQRPIVAKVPAPPSGRKRYPAGIDDLARRAVALNAGEIPDQAIMKAAIALVQRAGVDGEAIACGAYPAQRQVRSRAADGGQFALRLDLLLVEQLRPRRPDREEQGKQHQGGTDSTENSEHLQFLDFAARPNAVHLRR